MMKVIHHRDGLIPGRLYLQWGIACILCACGAIGCFLILRTVWQPEYAWRWLWQAVLMLVCILGTLLQRV